MVYGPPDPRHIAHAESKIGRQKDYQKDTNIGSDHHRGGGKPPRVFSTGRIVGAILLFILVSVLVSYIFFG